MKAEVINELPTDPKQWTWEDIDQALYEIRLLEEEIERDKANAEESIRTIREAFEAVRKANDTHISDHAAKVRVAFARLKKELGEARSRELAWGTVGAREVSSVKFDKGVAEQDAIRRAEAAGLYEVVQVEKRLLKEALKAKGAGALELCCCRLARQERFFYETRRGVSRPVRKTA